MEETLGGLKIIKGFTGERYMRSSFQNHNQQFYKESVALYRKNDLTSPLSEIVVTAILMLILYYGGTLVFAGELSGALFITFFGLASQLIPPIKQISTAYNSYQKGLASQERIDKILNANQQIPKMHRFFLHLKIKLSLKTSLLNTLNAI